MIEFLDPRKIEPVHPELWNTSGWNYSLDYPWTIAHAGKPSLILDVGCYVKPYSPLAAFLVKETGAKCVGLDRKFGEEFSDYKGDAPDLILWISSLEHNTKEQMKALYLRSMEILAPGGVFLATVAVASSTYWHKESKQTNLSPDDALQMFGEHQGLNWQGFIDTWKAYRLNKDLRQRYTKRYGHFDDYEPAFVTAGVMQCSPM